MSENLKNCPNFNLQHLLMMQMDYLHADEVQGFPAAFSIRTSSTFLSSDINLLRAKEKGKTAPHHKTEALEISSPPNRQTQEVVQQDQAIIFYFKARREAGDYTIFMGLDKYENEELMKYGFPKDIWFHVYKMSSAHVYVRLHKGQTIDSMSKGLLEDCAQLVKTNSIQGNKVKSVDAFYTPWSNLKKIASMDVGQVGLYGSKMVRTVKVEKRINETVNRLNKTKVERSLDLKAEREAYNQAEKAERKIQQRDKKRLENMNRLEKEKHSEIRSYKGLMVAETMMNSKKMR